MELWREKWARLIKRSRKFFLSKIASEKRREDKSSGNGEKKKWSGNGHNVKWARINCPLSAIEQEADMNKSLLSIEKLAAHGFAITNAEKQKQITSKVFSAINLLSHSPHERIAIFLSLANVICPIQASIVLECNS